jgi:hypothetical protein
MGTIMRPEPQREDNVTAFSNELNDLLNTITDLNIFPKDENQLLKQKVDILIEALQGCNDRM